MRFRGSPSTLLSVVVTAAAVAILNSQPCEAQVSPNPQPGVAAGSDQNLLREAEDELRQGTALTRKGLFREAIPHLVAARGRVQNEYAASFNLALCYLGTRQFKPALQVLDDLARGGHDGADVENLRAQAHIGNAQPNEALAALQKAATLAPQNEKLYLFVADSCMDSQDYALGLKVVDTGLRNLTQSSRLHYERGMLLSQLDRFDQAKLDFELAIKLAPGSEIAYLSQSHKALFEGNILEAIRTAREGISRGFGSPILLTILGEALLRSGVSPNEPEFVEAQRVLEQSVAQRSNDPSSQIAIGQLYLMAGRLDDAIAHLEKARDMRPRQPSVYASLAKAYQRHGYQQAAQAALTTLAQLNQAQAERIRSAPGDSKMGYGGPALQEATVDPHR